VSAAGERAPSRLLRRQRRRRRLAGLARLVVFALVLVVAVWAGVRVAHAGADARLYTGVSYQVRAGDTVWGIAAAYYDDTVDVREAVYDIRQANGLQHAVLHPGDTLRLPYEGE
jgi:nucleoid-associated protein YgaU